MADVVPINVLRPTLDFAVQVAALPYDVYSRSEAAVEIAERPLSFLRIDKSCALLPDADEYSPEVYERARAELDAAIAGGTFIFESEAAPDVPIKPHYYIYRMIEGGHVQTGIIAGASVADYYHGNIKRHENTREHKQQDRVAHILALEAQTGPVFITYRAQEAIDKVIERIISSSNDDSRAPLLYDFTAPDGVRHTIWRLDDSIDRATLRQAFVDIDTLYIADGHHRAAAACAIGRAEREVERLAGTVTESIAANTLLTDHFLALFVPDNQVNVLDYNRVIADLNGHTPSEILALVSEKFELEPIAASVDYCDFKPQIKRLFAMYLDGTWYRLRVRFEPDSEDVVAGLDAQILQDHLLAPILGIDDPKSSPRIAYVGGVRGLGELKRRVDAKGGVAFALAPLALDQLFAVADADRLMPPKSTWFEPKPRSGLFIRPIVEV